MNRRPVAGRFRPKGRTAARVSALAIAAALLTGCSAIADSGPVEVGLETLKEDDTGQLQYSAQSPVAGASQEDLVRGFLQAAVASTDDYSVAREFLSPDYAAQWDPDSSVLLDGIGERSYHPEGADSGVLSLKASAKVDADGLMLPVEPGPSTDLRFEFVRIGKEWRISSAPNGIVLDVNTFNTIWASRQIYFVGQGGYLVPETRWFLSRTALTTEIVGALLQGPGEHLRDVVRSGFPSGTTLVSNSVPVVDGRARVDLSSAILDAGPEAMAQIKQQLSWSLQSVSGVTGFELFSEGTAVRTDGSAEPDGPQPINNAAAPYVRMGNDFGTVIAGDFSQSAGLSEGVIDLHPRAVAVAANGEAAAVLHEDGVSRVDADGSVLVDARPGQLAPGLDAFGYVWTVQQSSSGFLQATAADGVAKRIDVPWLAGRSPVAVRISSDGSRVAALLQEDDKSVVLVAGIIRDSEGVPLRTTAEAEAQLWAKGAPVDMDWVGQSTFAVLTKAAAGSKVVLGGQGVLSAELGAVPGGSQISGNGSRTQLRVLGADGGLYSAQGGGWQRAPDPVALLAKQG